MAKKLGTLRKRKIIQFFAAGAVILLVLLAGFFIYKYFLKPNNYLIENKYYGFKLQTPHGWLGLEKTDYSEEKIAGILVDCKNNKKTNKVGEFRFSSQRYSEDLTNLGNSSPSGMILEIIINCTNGGAFQHISNKYIHISSADKPIEQKLRQSYSGILDKIIFSFVFTK